MNPFTFISKWFWAISILATFANVVGFRARVRPLLEANPELEEGFRSMMRAFLTWGNLPWVVMGIGCLWGGVPSVFHFFRPVDGNPYVLAFYASVVLVWVLGTNWLVFRGGAEIVVKYPGLFNIPLNSPRTVIVFWFLGLAGGITALLLMFSGAFPVPN
jgi:hypothetical protein